VVPLVGADVGTDTGESTGDGAFDGSTFGCDEGTVIGTIDGTGTGATEPDTGSFVGVNTGELEGSPTTSGLPVVPLVGADVGTDTGESAGESTGDGAFDGSTFGWDETSTGEALGILPGLDTGAPDVVGDPSSLLSTKVFPLLSTPVTSTTEITLGFSPSLSVTSVNPGLFVSSRLYTPGGTPTNVNSPSESVSVVPNIFPLLGSIKVTRTPGIPMFPIVSPSTSSKTLPLMIRDFSSTKSLPTESNGFTPPMVTFITFKSTPSISETSRGTVGVLVSLTE
jgi:hypothetical protein